jgi:hypothetical protein
MSACVPTIHYDTYVCDVHLSRRTKFVLENHSVRVLGGETLLWQPCVIMQRCLNPHAKQRKDCKLAGTFLKAIHMTLFFVVWVALARTLSEIASPAPHTMAQLKIDHYN